MTKAELVNAIAIKTGYDKTTIMNVVESAMDNIKNTVAAGETVYLRGFGSFGTKVRKQKWLVTLLKKSLSSFQNTKFLHSRHLMHLQRF